MAKKLTINGCKPNNITITHPEIAAQWDYEKNGNKRPEMFTHGSEFKAWWACENDARHSWQATISSRVRGTGCPICAGKLIVPGINDLVTVVPGIDAEWDYEKNGDTKPNTVAFGSYKKVWWTCSEGHSFDMVIYDYATRRSCPICSGKRVQEGANDLATIKPELAAEWHPTKNGDLLPTMVTRCSNKKVWWLCEKGHEWQAVVNNRYRLGRGCPYCAGLYPIEGETDLATLYPDVAKSWSSLNGDLKPTMCTANSGKKVWWECELGHTWRTAISVRTVGRGCPYCASQKVWPGFNDLATKNPELAAEWHPTKNGDLLPENVLSKSNKKVWWQCQHGHEWVEHINNRARGDHNCPVCSGHKVVAGVNDLATLSPELAAQWHPTKNGALKPTDVTAKNDRIVWWICEKGHSYRAGVGSRYRNNHGCPYCVNKKVLKGFNDLATTHPDIARQWCYKKNGKATPDMITYGARRMFWWECENGHTWRSLVSNRSKGSGCPICKAKYHTSLAEKSIVHYLPFDDLMENARNVLDGLGRMELDIYIPSIKTAIEYDGEYYHTNAKSDLRKDKVCEKNGVRMIRVREPGCPKYESNAEFVYREHNSSTESLEKAILEVLALLDVNGVDVNLERDKDAIAILRNGE